MFYNILSYIHLNSPLKMLEGWNELDYFSSEKKDSKVDLEIVIELYSQSQYGIDVIPDHPGIPILKANDSMLSVNNDWTLGKIISFDGNKFDIYKLLNALVFTHLSTRHAIEMHASLIDISGRGIMFLGPSGIGKNGKDRRSGFLCF